MGVVTGVVVVMAKAPQLGTVKTRLQPVLGADRCAQLQDALTARMLATAAARYRTYLAVTPAGAIGAMTSLVPAEVPVFAQRGRDLGERMANAVDDVHRPHTAVVVVGTDTPTVDAGRLAAAFAALDAHDVVIGPALDGGYYLIGMSSLDRSLFDLPTSAWGGPDVLDLTLRRVHAAGRSVWLLPVDRDLDTPDDAAVMVGDLRVPAPIRQLLAPAGLRREVPA